MCAELAKTRKRCRFMGCWVNIGWRPASPPPPPLLYSHCPPQPQDQDPVFRGFNGIVCAIHGGKNARDAHKNAFWDSHELKVWCTLTAGVWNAGSPLRSEGVLTHRLHTYGTHLFGPGVGGVFKLSGCTTMYCGFPSAESQSTLKALHIGANEIADAGFVMLMNSLERNAALATLDIGCNDLTDRGFRALGRVLERNDTLATVSVHNNDIGTAGCAALADGLRTNTALTALNIGSNGLTDDGCCALAEVRHNCHSCGTCVLWASQGCR